MMIEQHYDEEVLAGFLAEPIDSAARDRHLSACSLCKQTLNSIRDTARAAGMKTLRDDGFEKVKAGVTTLEEIYRATT